MSVGGGLYKSSPIWLQHGLVSARGLGYRLLRSNTGVIRRELTLLRQTQYWSNEDLVGLQEERLRSLVSHAFGTVPYYRDLRKSIGIDARDIRTLSDLQKLPILEKTGIRGAESRFQGRVDQSLPLYVNYTSGTTGTPIRTVETRESFSRRWAFVARLREWAGVDPYYPRRAQFTGRSIVPDRVSRAGGVFWRHNLPGRALLFSSTHISSATIPDYAAALRRFQPDVVEGYVSAILAVARGALDQGVPLPRVKAVITTAETLHTEARNTISAAFSCRVHNQYAASEPSCFWGSCEEGVLHQSPEYGVSEIIKPDGTPAAAGETGSVVVTSFLNPAMPLLRYRVGDDAVAGSFELCGCGRTLPRVEAVLGRDDDVLYIPTRGYIGRLDPVFKGLEGILEAQIIQESLHGLRVLLVTNGAFDERSEARLLTVLRERVGTEVDVSIERVSDIPRDGNGKFRAVVTRVRGSYPAADKGAR